MPKYNLKCSKEEYDELQRLRDVVSGLEGTVANLRYLVAREPWAKLLPKEWKEIYNEDAIRYSIKAEEFKKRIKELEEKCFGNRT